jgi:anti-sigma factor ChrR (cupin superfamily)
MFAHHNARRAIVAALALVSIPVAAGATDIATCQQLQQRCDATVASLQDVLAHVDPSQVDTTAASQNILSYDCENRYAQAQQNGVFPGRTPEPDLPCTN